MAPHWLICSTAVFLVLVYTVPVVTQYCGNPGIPGIPGIHGQHGIDGNKGARGDPGESGRSMKGEKGMKGSTGPPGRPGVKGDPGLPGSRGFPGPPGGRGRPFTPSNSPTSFFSYKMSIPQPTEINTDMDFSRAILPNLDEQYKGLSLSNGRFTCVTKGVYFFSYHISAKSRVCLQLMKGTNSHMSLCDTSEGFLISSGLAVLELEVGDTVSLQPTRFNTIATSQSSSNNIFTGFLIFPTT